MLHFQYKWTKFLIKPLFLTSLQVYGGPDLSAPQLAKLCTTTSSPMQVSSTGNMMTVRFKSDAYVSGRGFNASWTEVQGGGWTSYPCIPIRHISIQRQPRITHDDRDYMSINLVSSRFMSACSCFYVPWFISCYICYLCVTLSSY